MNDNKEKIDPNKNPEKINWGTQWPKTIGKKDKPNDDGKIRDVWGNVLE